MPNVPFDPDLTQRQPAELLGRVGAEPAVAPAGPRDAGAVTPTIGRVVHFVCWSPNVQTTPRPHVPAIVVSVAPDQRCTLFVMEEWTTGNYHDVRHDEDEKQAGTWHWPERAE